MVFRCAAATVFVAAVGLGAPRHAFAQG